MARSSENLLEMEEQEFAVSEELGFSKEKELEGASAAGEDWCE